MQPIFDLEDEGEDTETETEAEVVPPEPPFQPQLASFQGFPVECFPNAVRDYVVQQSGDLDCDRAAVALPVLLTVFAHAGFAAVKLGEVHPVTSLSAAPQETMGLPLPVDARLMRIARADNIVDAVGEQWPHLSLEFIIAMRPEVILDGAMGTDAASSSDFWEKYPTIPAVRDRRVYGYAEDPMLHAGPRVGQSLEIIARKIHPEAWPRGAEK